MHVTIDPDAGFCFGVDKAIRTAEAQLDHHQPLYCLGDLVHNKAELDRLKQKGLTIISRQDFNKLEGSQVLLRAHGEPPETYRLASQAGVSILDATCPIVLKLQQKIRETIIEHQDEAIQVVIFGKKGHPEVDGLQGQTDGQAIVVHNEADLDLLDYSLPIYLFSQTTMSSEDYLLISGLIRQRMTDHSNDRLVISKSFCRQVSGRTGSIKKFAASHDVIIFASDRNSSNGAFLFQLCSAANSRSYFVHDASEISSEWLKNAESIGITGATSTPGWLMDEIAATIRHSFQK